MLGVNAPVLPEKLTVQQQEVVSYPREDGGSLFVRGLPGTGKTAALVARLAALLREGRRPYEILVLLPQRAQAERYEEMLSRIEAPTRGGADIVTFYGLSRRAVALFWPLVSRVAGFAHPDREPTFLTVETTQYFMWRVVEPLIAQEGYFRDLAIRRGRLLSQLVDNLNKAALVGFDHTEVYQRLRAAWAGSPDRLHSIWQAQDCAIRFREYCLAHNLLDFSLTTEVYSRYLLGHEVYQRYYRAHYRHLLVDGLEENVPVAHDMLDWARQQMRSTVLVYDDGGGYRIFLGADAQSALEVGSRCRDALVFGDLLRPTADPLALADAVRGALRVDGPSVSPHGMAKRAIAGQGPVRDEHGSGRYWISMIRWVAARIAELVVAGTAADEIAIVAPYVSEVMRFAMEEQLASQGIPLYLLRPATPLRDDPVIRALLTVALLGHPDWQIIVQGEERALPVEDVALALQMCLEGLDPIRARHLAQAALGGQGAPGRRALLDLSTASGPDPRELGRLWESVGYQVREHYETLRVWLETYQLGEPEPVDVFLSKLFGGLLSKPGYGFHSDLGRVRLYGRLVESASKFRAAVALDETMSEGTVAREYVQLILGGIASAEYLLDWPRPLQGAVILAPAYAYLTRGICSSYQFWLDLGSDGWWNRPNQPLTHPYVLSRRWPVGQPWRDVEEEQVKRETLARIVQGLAARCTKGIYLAYSELGIGGEEQSGRLQRVLMQSLARIGSFQGRVAR